MASPMIIASIATGEATASAIARARPLGLLLLSCP